MSGWLETKTFQHADTIYDRFSVNYREKRIKKFAFSNQKALGSASDNDKKT